MNIISKNKKNVLKVVCIFAFSSVLVPNIYFIANQLGITMAPDWYQKIVDWVAAGGTLTGAFAAIAGITLPAWVVTVAAAFGIVSA